MPGVRRDASPSLAGYPDWCGACGWNLERPPAPWDAPAGGSGGSPSGSAGAPGSGSARELRAADELRPRLTAAKALAYALAAGVHVFTLALAGFGVAAIVRRVPEPVLDPVRARDARAPRRSCARACRGMPDGDRARSRRGRPRCTRSRATSPTALERPAPDAIVADTRWNASWALVGWRRRRVLVVGLPLLAALGPQERVAMIAHEVGHDRNGDVTRGLFVGSAVAGLDALSDALRPPRRPRAASTWAPSSGSRAG